MKKKDEKPWRLQGLQLMRRQETGLLQLSLFTGKLGKEYIKARYCYPAYLMSMQSTSCKMPRGMNHKLKSRLRRNINNLRYADDITLMAESEEELKSLLMRVKEESERAGLKLNIKKKTNIMASSPITSWQIEGGK